MKKKRTAEAANTQLRKSKANTEGMAAATQGIQEKLEKDLRSASEEAQQVRGRFEDQLHELRK